MKAAADPVVDDAFTGVEDELGITAAGPADRPLPGDPLPPAPAGATAKAHSPQVQPSALTAQERAAVLELMNSDEYAELPPAQIWARELDASRYHCSVSTMYQVGRTASAEDRPPTLPGRRRS
jgi:putative transposase